MTNAHSIGAIAPTQAKSTKRLTTDEFIRRAKSKHGDRYIYARAIYKNRRSKITITCKEHGDFEQKSIDHMGGSNCSQCVQADRSLTTTDFIQRSKALYGGLYTYEKTKYIDYRTKLTITCKLHGDFSHRAEQHFNCNGCPRCSLERYSGFSRSDFQGICHARGVVDNATLYVIECSQGSEIFYKIGITSRDIETRFKKAGFPYDYKIIADIKGAPSFIFDLEKKLQRLARQDNYKPAIHFGGSTECFSRLSKGVLDIIKGAESDNRKDMEYRLP